MHIFMYICMCAREWRDGWRAGQQIQQEEEESTRTNATNVKYADTMCLVSPLKGCSAFTLNPISMLLLHDLVVE